ncbi:MAG: hypothetical protein AAGA56_21200 [Myxococcota bacterium]
MCRWSVVPVALCALTAVACGDEDAPVEIATEKRTVAVPQPPPPPPPLTSPPPAAASATAKKQVYVPRHTRITACCNAVRRLRDTSLAEENKQKWTAASNVCSAQRAQVRLGKLKEQDALRVVRGAIQGRPPSSCH